MVDIDVTSLILITLTPSLVVIIAVYWVGFVWRRQLHRYENWLAPSSVIIETYSGRLRNVESTLVELRSRLDIIQARLPRIERPAAVQTSRTPVETPSSSTAPAGPRPPRPVSGEDTRLKVLRYLVSGPKSSTQMLPISGVSREHTLRLLKSMTEEGLVARSAGRPFQYSLTDRGRNMVSSSGQEK